MCSITLQVIFLNILIKKLATPRQILAVTFTNKAAAEMKLRIQESIACDGVNVGTFHSIGARMLRMHISSLNEGYNSSFTIYDTSDQKSVIKEVVENLNLSEFKELNVSFLKVQIDKFKNDNLLIKDIESEAQTFEDEKIVENVQKGINSSFYHSGRFSPKREKGVHHFHCLISQFINHK